MYSSIILSNPTSEKKIITLALMDSGNSLSYSVREQIMHERLAIGLDATPVQARMANSQPVGVLGIIKAIELKVAGINE